MTTPAEEHQQFYASLGIAITQWAHTERALLDVYIACLGIQNASVKAMFYTVENLGLSQSF
jgi:hypothetical protein